LSGHPAFGAIWEQIVLSNLKGLYPEAELFYYRTTNGAEMDFVMKIRNSVFAIECKASHAPVLSKGNTTPSKILRRNIRWLSFPLQTVGL
jgi:predicted AAA+ superfamily ATPase